MIRLAVKGKLTHYQVYTTRNEGVIYDSLSKSYIKFRSRSKKIAKEIAINSFNSMTMEGYLKNCENDELILIVTKVNGVEEND